MPRLHSRYLARREYGPAHFAALASGFDYFGAGWGDCVHPIPPATRDTWPTADVLAEMRDCWSRHREEIIAEYGRTHGRPLWGETQFD